MATNPINLAFRFLLEMAALIATGVAGWQLTGGVWRWVSALVVPLLMATVWGTFNVADDPSRGGAAPVPVPGWVRLAIELGFFGVAVMTTWRAGMTTFAVVMGVAVVVHYALSWDRIVWLLE